MKESERSFVESEESGVATCNETKPAISISAEISSAFRHGNDAIRVHFSTPAISFLAKDSFISVI